jgi:hypothetical protein
VSVQQGSTGRVNLASDYAADLGIRENGNDLTMKWYYNFMRRWPELHAVKPSGLSELIAKAASPECIKKYFEELERILDRHGLKENPQQIFNVDEKGINTGGSKQRDASASCDLGEIANSYCSGVWKCYRIQHSSFSSVSWQTFATRTIGWRYYWL